MAKEILVRNEEEAFGSIRYKLIRNGYLSRKAKRDVYVASVLKKEGYGTMEVADRMVREGCIAKKNTIILVLNEFAELIGRLVSEGRSVNIGGVVRFMPVIHGTFDSPDEGWDPQKHSIAVKACVGGNMRKAAAKSPVTRITKNSKILIKH